jgi:hypothetical protein
LRVDLRYAAVRPVCCIIELRLIGDLSAGFSAAKSIGAVQHQ